MCVHQHCQGEDKSFFKPTLFVKVFLEVISCLCSTFTVVERAKMFKSDRHEFKPQLYYLYLYIIGQSFCPL